MIMTLAMATFLQGLLIIIAGGSAISAAEPAGRLARQRPAGRHSRPASCSGWSSPRPRSIVMHATPFGARIFAIGANPLAARLSGVPCHATTTIVYAHQRLHVGARRHARARHERPGLCRHRRSLPARLDRRRRAGRHVDPRRARHLCRHDTRRDPAGDDHGADHRGQRLAGLAQHPLRLADPRPAAAVGPGSRRADEHSSRTDRGARRCHGTGLPARLRRTRP